LLQKIESLADAVGDPMVTRLDGRMLNRVLHDRLLFAGRAKITIRDKSWKSFPEGTGEIVSHLTGLVQDRFAGAGLPFLRLVSRSGYPPGGNPS
jgi:hypothetical protein